MPDLNELFQMIMGGGEPSVAPNGGKLTEPWQKDLISNPEDDKRKAIAQALIQGAQTLGSTPGNFLQGLGQALPAGAQGYMDTMDTRKEDRRKQILNYLDEGRRGENAQTNRAYKAFNAARGIKSDERADARLGLERERMDLKRSGALTPDQKRDMTLRVENAVSDYAKGLGLDSEFLAPEDRTMLEQKVDEYRQGLETRLGLREPSSEPAAPEPSAPQYEDEREIDGKRYIKQKGQWYEVTE